MKTLYESLLKNTKGSIKNEVLDIELTEDNFDEQFDALLDNMAPGFEKYINQYLSYTKGSRKPANRDYWPMHYGIYSRADLKEAMLNSPSKNFAFNVYMYITGNPSFCKSMDEIEKPLEKLGFERYGYNNSRVEVSSQGPSVIVNSLYDIYKVILAIKK